MKRLIEISLGALLLGIGLLSWVTVKVVQHLRPPSSVAGSGVVHYDGPVVVLSHVAWDGKAFHCEPAGAVCPPGTEALPIAKLRAEAHRRGLAWFIVCSYDGDGFFGAARIDGTPISEYIEEGAKPGWWARGATQEDTAEHLFKAISREPNDYPEHKPAETKEADKNCPPPLEGR